MGGERWTRERLRLQRIVTGTGRTESSAGWDGAKDDLVRLQNPIGRGISPEYMLLTLHRKRTQAIQERAVCNHP